MSFLDGLNKQQKEAAQCVDSHLRIIAGAGSGNLCGNDQNCIPVEESACIAE